MSLRLPFFQSGRPLVEQVTADKLNQLVEAIRQCEVHSGVGYDVSRGPGGATLTIRQQGHQYKEGGTGVLKLVGPSNSGMSHTDASVVVNPGVQSYGFQCKTPTGSYTTAAVHGMTFSSYATFNTENNKGKITVENRRAYQFSYPAFVQKNLTGVNLSQNDLYRRIGLLSFQGSAYLANANSLSGHASGCDAIQTGDFVHVNLGVSGDRGLAGFSHPFGSCVVVPGLRDSRGEPTAIQYSASSTATIGIIKCSGTTYVSGTTCLGTVPGSYYTFSNESSMDGNFYRDTAHPSEQGLYPQGNYSYSRKFNLGDISPLSVKVRLKIRISFGTFVSVKLNGANISYTNFETQTATYIPLEISSGFISGENQLEIVINNTSTSVYPSVSFEFLPTTATIVTTAGFSILTDAQKDLVGDGTPVQVTVGVTSSLYAYNGSGDKGTTASYTFVRDV